MAWKTSPYNSGTVAGTGTPEVLLGETTFAVTGMTAADIGRCIIFNIGQTFWDAAVIVDYAGGDVTIDKPLRGNLFGGDPWITSEDAEAGESAGDLSENSNSNQRGYNSSSQIQLSGTGFIGYVGIKQDTFDIAQSPTDGPYTLESGTNVALMLSSMLFATRSGGSGQEDGNEIIAIGSQGSLWAVNTFFHSIQNTIFRMTGEGQCWWEDVVNIGMTRIELRGDVDWFNVFLEGRENTADLVELDHPTDTAAQNVEIVGLVMKNMNGFASQANPSQVNPYTIRNVTFLNPSPRIAQIEANVRFDFWNTVFNEPLTSTNVTFNGQTGVLTDRLAVFYDVVDLSGVPITGSVVYVTTVTGGDLIDSYSRDGVSDFFETATVRQRVTNVGNVWTLESFSDFFVKGYAFGKQPVILPLADVTTAETLTGLLSLAEDTLQASADFVSALTTGLGSIYRHVPTAQTNPMTVVAYDGGSAGLPGAFGATVTCGTATGTLIEYIGDEISGYLVVENRNAVAFPDNTAITISGSTFNGQSDTVTFNEDYSWLVDCGGITIQNTYDRTQALSWEGAGQDEVRKWYNSDNSGYLLYSNDGSNWFTKRNTTRNGGEGVWIARPGGGQITTMESDSGAVFTYPATVTVQVTVLDDFDGSPISGANVQLYLTSDYSTVVMSATTNASGIASVSWPYSTEQAVEGWAREMNLSGQDYEQNNIAGTINSSGLSIQTRLRRISV